MTIVLIASAALFCGISIGIIVGLVIAWRLNKPDREDVFDYSDGY